MRMPVAASFRRRRKAFEWTFAGLTTHACGGRLAPPQRRGRNPMENSLVARLGCALICIFVLGQAAAAQPQKRLSWQEFSKDSARVAIFRESVRVMKSRDGANKKSAEYRSSWQYWAAIHGYLGNGA